MKVFAFNPSYSEEFDPYFVPAETREEAENKIKEAYPHRSFTIYELKEIKYPGLAGKAIPGIYSLEATGKYL